MNTIRVGALSVACVEESVAPGFDVFQIFEECTPDELERHRPWLAPDYLDAGSNKLMISMHSWLVRTERHTILVDACGGDHKNRPAMPRFHQKETGYLNRLNAAGVVPEQIDYVMCTHLHVDHVGWNTQLRDGRWVPTFPNARYLMSRKEHAHWEARSKDPDRGGINAGVYEDSVLPVIEAGQATFADEVFEIESGLVMEPAPGHTPGHSILQAESPGEHAVFCGDMVHSPLQVHNPAWNSRFCELPEAARTTRQGILAHCCEHRGRLFPAHFGGSHFGSVEDAAGGFRFIPGKVE